MSLITNCIGSIKQLQRAINRERSERLFRGHIDQDSAEYIAYLLMYQRAMNLRYLLQLAEDEMWLELIREDKRKLP